MSRFPTDHDVMIAAQASCVPCKLCGGSAVITDAGPGAGYYIRCGSSTSFRTYMGCLISDRRVSGSANNARNWWNRLHSTVAPTDSGPDATLMRARITAASDALLSKPYLSDDDRERVRTITPTDSGASS